MLAFSFVIVLLALPLLSADVINTSQPPQDLLDGLGEGDGEEETPREERLDRLETLLSRQDRLLRAQADRLSQQEQSLATQAQQLARQDSVITQQSQELSSVRDVLRAQSEKLLDQERLLSRHDGVIAQQSQELSSVRDELREQSEKLWSQERLLFHQETEVQRLRASVDRLEKGVASKHHQSPTQLANTVTQENHVTHLPLQTRNTSDDAHHDVAARADDSDPLEAVVQQLDQRLTVASADIQALQNSDTQQAQDIRDASTSTFTRWGHSQCPSSSQLVYSGVVGGSHYAHSGAATNYLCLTMSPVLSDHNVPTILNFLYGSEYQTLDSHMDKDVVCSVCRSTFSTTIMIPGTNVCTSGWHRQYNGYLMAGYYNHAAGSEFICVDTMEEGRPGSSHNDDGKLLYYTATRCGSLPCEPYFNNKIVTCVVCSL